MHGTAKVRCPPFPPRAQHQHSGCQLWLGVCAGGHAGGVGEGLGAVMVEWPSSESEPTFDQSAANGRKEPNLTDAAMVTNGDFHGIL